MFMFMCTKVISSKFGSVVCLSEPAVLNFHCRLLSCVFVDADTSFCFLHVGAGQLENPPRLLIPQPPSSPPISILV